MLMGALGTPGYVDPSYVSNAGPACDIYSFGVVLLQLVTGKRACDSLRDEAAYYITDWVNWDIPTLILAFGPFTTHYLSIHFTSLHVRNLPFNPHLFIYLFILFWAGSVQIRVRRLRRNTRHQPSIDGIQPRDSASNGAARPPMHGPWPEETTLDEPSGAGAGARTAGSRCATFQRTNCAHRAGVWRRVRLHMPILRLRFQSSGTWR